MFKLRGLRWRGRSRTRKKNAFKFLVHNPEGNSDLNNLVIDGRENYTKLILKTHD
jgi:hypothetical protein